MTLQNVRNAIEAIAARHGARLVRFEYWREYRHLDLSVEPYDKSEVVLAEVAQRFPMPFPVTLVAHMQDSC